MKKIMRLLNLFSMSNKKSKTEGLGFTQIRFNTNSKSKESTLIDEYEYPLARLCNKAMVYGEAKVFHLGNTENKGYIRKGENFKNNRYYVRDISSSLFNVIIHFGLILIISIALSVFITSIKSLF